MLQLLHELFHLLLGGRGQEGGAGLGLGDGGGGWGLAAMPAEADPATPAGPAPPLLPVEAAGPTEVDPAAAGPVPVLPVEAAGGLLGAAGWAEGGELGGGGRGRGGGWGLGAGGPGRAGRGLGLGEGGGGLGLGTGRQKFLRCTSHTSIPSMSMCFSCFGRQQFLRCTSHTCRMSIQLLHELFHLLLAVRAEAACATASGSSWASRSGSSNTRRCQSKQLGEPK